MTADDMRASRLGEALAKWGQPPEGMVSQLPQPTKRDNPRGHCNECGQKHGLPAVHLNYMGHAEKLTHAGKTLATWKCAKASNRIDTKALAQAHPDIASAFTTSVLGSRRFLLKDAS
jgi:hypothetical protein